MAERPALVTKVRGIGLPDRLVTAIEEIQAAVRASSSGLSPDLVREVQRLVAAGPTDGSGVIPGGEVQDLSPPPAPANLSAEGGYGIVFLRWDPSTDRRLGFVEVWRSATNNVGTAVQIGTSASNLYVDEVQAAQTYFYWVRAVNRWSNVVKSGFTPSGTTGVQAASAPDVDYLLSLLSGAYGAGQPFYTLDVPTTIDGVLVPAGFYANEAFLRNAAIGGAQIKTATITDANIASLNAGKITMDSLVGRLAQIVTGDFQTIFAGKAFIEDANVLNLSASKITAGTIGVGQFIQSQGYVSGSAGWRVNADGTAEFSSVTVRGAFNAGSYIGYAWPAGSGTGAHLSSAGLLLGNPSIGRYFQVTGGGDIYAPGFSVVGGVATFSGSLSAASGSFAGTLTGQVITTGNLVANAVTAPAFAAAATDSATGPVVGVNLVGDRVCVLLASFDVGSGPNDTQARVQLYYQRPGFFGATLIEDALADGATHAPGDIVVTRPTSRVAIVQMITPGADGYYEFFLRATGQTCNSRIAVLHTKR